MIVKTTFDNEKDNSNSSKAVTTYLNNSLGIRRSLDEFTRNSTVIDIYTDRIIQIPRTEGRYEFLKVIMSANYEMTTRTWQQTMFFYLKFKDDADELEWIYYSRNYISGLTYIVQPYWRNVGNDVWIMVKPDSGGEYTQRKTFFGDKLAATFNTHVFYAIPELTP